MTAVMKTVRAITVAALVSLPYSAAHGWGGPGG